MNKTRNSLPPQVRKEAINALNQTVIELFDLFACIKQAHWNMSGTLFIKLDELARHIMGHNDHAAERATALGALPTARSAGARNCRILFKTRTNPCFTRSLSS